MCVTNIIVTRINNSYHATTLAINCNISVSCVYFLFVVVAVRLLVGMVVVKEVSGHISTSGMSVKILAKKSPMGC